MNPKILYSIYISLNIIIIIDIILILYEIIFNVSPNIAYNIHVFDLIVCTILLTEFSIKFYISKSKKIFIKNNWLDLIASIPFDLILPSIFSTIRFIRLIRLLKLLRVVVLFKKFLKDINKFLKRSHLDRILSGIMITVLIFTVLLYLFGPNFNLFDSLYFVAARSNHRCAAPRRATARSNSRWAAPHSTVPIPSSSPEKMRCKPDRDRKSVV